MSNTKTTLTNDGERMVPELHTGTLIYAEHMSRYLAAQEISKDKVVLDIASGSGYGTHLLSKYAKKVYGVDVNKDAVSYSKENYSASNIEFLVGDGESIPLKDNSVDLVVTFETIEHIKDYKKFLSEVKRVLKPDGLAIISTPNDLEFAEGNHFHLHEFEYDELLKLLKSDYKFVDSYFQATWKYVALGTENFLKTKGKIEADVISYSSPDPKEYLYFYLVCSNRKITEKISDIGMLGEHYSDRKIIGMQMVHEKNISDYKSVLNDLKLENRKLADSNKSLSDKLVLIEGSRTYKLAKKISKTKNSILKK